MSIIFSFYIYLFFIYFAILLLIMHNCIVASAFVFYFAFYAFAFYYLHVAFFSPALHYKQIITNLWCIFGLWCTSWINDHKVSCTLTKNTTGGPPMSAIAVESFLMFPPAVASCGFVFIFHQAQFTNGPNLPPATNKQPIRSLDISCNINSQTFPLIAAKNWPRTLPSLGCPAEWRKTPDVLVQSAGRWWHQTADSSPYSDALHRSLSAPLQKTSQEFGTIMKKVMKHIFEMSCKCCSYWNTTWALFWGLH